MPLPAAAATSKQPAKERNPSQAGVIMRGSEFHRNRCSFGVLCGAAGCRCVAESFRELLLRVDSSTAKQLQLSGAQEWSGNRRRRHGARKKRAGGGDRRAQSPVGRCRDASSSLLLAQWRRQVEDDGRQLATRTTQVTGPELVLKTCVQ